MGQPGNLLAFIVIQGNIMTGRILICVFALFLTGIGPARADWILDQENSSLSFGSIKKNSIGESNHFRHLDGKITQDGDVALFIDLSSVETWVDIRNARIKEFLFQTADFPMATLRGQVDMEKFKEMKVGSQQSFEIAFDLDFHGLQQTIEAELVVIRLTDSKVMVVPDGIIFLDGEKFNLLSGLKKLQQLAKLPSISSAVPVVFHLAFNQVP